MPTNLGTYSLRAELFVGHPKTTPAFDYFTLRVRRIFCCNFKAIPPVQMGCAKIFRFCCRANHLYQLARLTPPEGRIARRHERGVGCGGRGSVGRAGYCRAGLACERSSSAPDERRFNAFIGISAGGTWPAGSVDGGCCVRRSRVVLASVADVKLAEAKPAQPGADTPSIRSATVTKGIRRRGEREVSR